MRIFSQTKIHFSRYIAIFFIGFFSLSLLASACSVFSIGGCPGDDVIYCQPGDNCSLSGGTNVVSRNINSIETNDKFSVYVQKIIAYLLGFLALVGVIYILYAGFNVLTAGGDEDKVKKSKSTIFHVVIGLLLIFLAYSIVTFFIGGKNGGGLFRMNNSGSTSFELPSFIETTYAYTEYDLNTFDSYKKDIELLSSTLDNEYQVNNKITIKTLTTLGTLVKSSMETFPSSDNIVFNTNLAQSLLTAIEIVKKSPDSDTAISNLAKSLNDYLTKVKIGRITGKITASPESGNAPFTVTLRANEVVDPSGVTIQKENYKWWIRTSGGKMSPIGTGPSINYTFPEERTYTVFLNILSSSRNKNGRVDVLPFDGSVNINVLPKLGNVSLAINGIYVSHLEKIKFTPAQGRQGLLIDAISSTPAAGTKFISTRFDFGNGNVAQYNGAPLLDRQIFSNVGNYKFRMELTTNENQKIVKELDIEIRDPISSIRTDRTNGFPRDEFRFNAYNSVSVGNFGYSWQITEKESEKTIFTSSLQNISYKFPRTGKYIVKLKTLASNGKDDIDSVEVTIEGRDPVANFEARTLNSESPNVIMLDATKSYDPDNLDGSSLTYAWIIDGVRTDISNPTRDGAMGRYTFDTIGNHHVTLEVSNKEGKTITADKDININSLLSVSLIASPRIVQAGSSVTIIATSKEAQTYEWQFGDGETDTSTSGRINHVYKKSGTYSVSLTVRGRNSDSNSISRKVYVMDGDTPFSIISLKRENEEIIPTADACDGKEAYVIDRAKPVTMSAENSVNTDGSTQGLAYTWKYGSRNSSQKDFSYKYDELGCFPITLTVRSQKTGAQHTASAYVKVENLAPKLSSLSVVADKMDADPVTVTVTANNAVDDDGVVASYIWYYYTADDPEPQDFRITKSSKTVFVLPRIGAKYYFAVILEDSNGLKVNSEDMNSEKYSLTLVSDNINTPIISLKTSRTSVSVDQKIDFTVSAKNILGADLADKAEYKWDFNGDGFYEETTNTPTVSHVYDKPGNFNFKVKVTYKGISNTKYQAITVKNEIQPNLEYIAIGKKFIFLNTTKGLYTKVKWSLADVISNTPDSFIYDFGADEVSGELSLEVSDGTNTKSMSTELKKDVLNAMKVKKSSEKLIYFTYPASDDDTVHITNSVVKLYIYLGESRGTIAKYGIDVDTLVDSNLNGDPADDIDNKGTDSSLNGAVFAIKSADATAKEKTMRLSLYDANNTVIATKDLKVVYDFVTGASTETLSGSTADVLPKDISDADKAGLEKLKDLIKSAKEQDRLKMMQYFATLQESWFDTREKTKTIIDFEAYIENNSALDTKTKESFYSLLESLLLSDTQVKDDVGLATKVLKSLIPKTNPSYNEIMKKIDDIISHPTNTPLNKELGTFILNAIKDDATIEVKDKNTIKSQLQTIIYGGQNNIPSTAPVPEVAGSTGGVIDWVISFGKILGFVFLGIIGLLILTFLLFKILNKDTNIGFQDFIIDKLSGKQPPEQTPSFVPPTVVKEPAPIKREETQQHDVLANITPIQKTEVDTPAMSTRELSHEDVVTPQKPMAEATIPDWLRESTSLSSQTSEVAPATPEPVIEAPITEIPTAPEVPEPVAVPEETPVSVAGEVPDLPDWLKGMSTNMASAEDTQVSHRAEESADQEMSRMISAEQRDNTPPDTADLPAWMQGMDQESLAHEVHEELASTPVSSEPENTSSYEDIPDWLRTPSVSTPPEIENIQETQAPVVPEEPVVHTEKKSEKKSSGAPLAKKEPKASVASEKKHTEAQTENNTEVTQARTKKKKPTPIVSEGPVITADSEELPDWLK